MSPFWQYFHDKLHWPAIFSPGPLSALAKGLALYMDDTREDILWLRRQYNPVTADDELIAGYGASRGILRTRFDTDTSYRLRVVNAYAWHQLGGKVTGLVRILAENGFAGAEILTVTGARLHDAAQEHNGTIIYKDGVCWAQFDVRLDIPEVGLDQEIMAWFRWLVNEYKPARSILRALSWKMGIEDSTESTDGTQIAVCPSYGDANRWGSPTHDGSICYNNGLFRAHDGRLAYSGTAPHTRWEPQGQAHDALLDPLNVAVQPKFAENVRYSPRHDGGLLYGGQGRHSDLDTAALDAVQIAVASAVSDSVSVQDSALIALGLTDADEVGRYYDGSINHGQRYTSIRNGAFSHDNSRLRGPFSGNVNYTAMRRNGKARHNATAMHRLWGWLPTAGMYAPVFTYAALSDQCATRLTTGMIDNIVMAELATLRVVRYAQHNGLAAHNAGQHYHGEEIAA